eukprot:COSAG04_NODE_1_length_58448_cov_23.476478_19_plen_175_part_00
MGWRTCSTASFSAATASSSFDRSCSNSSGAGCNIHTRSAQPSSLTSLTHPLADGSVGCGAHDVDPLAFLRSAPQRPQRIALRSYSARHNKPKPSAHDFSLAGGMTATILSKLLGSSCAFGFTCRTLGASGSPAAIPPAPSVRPPSVPAPPPVRRAAPACHRSGPSPEHHGRDAF